MVDNTKDDYPVNLQGHRYGKPGETVGKIGGAVKRIDDPLVALAPVRIKVLFSKEVVLRKRSLQSADQELF